MGADTLDKNTEEQKIVEANYEGTTDESEVVTVMDNSVIDSILDFANIDEETVNSCSKTLPSEKVFSSVGTLDSILDDAVVNLAKDTMGDIDGVFEVEEVVTEDVTMKVIQTSVLNIKQEMLMPDPLATDYKPIKSKFIGSILQCNYCSFTSKLKHFLEEHIRIVHIGELRFQCSACDFKSFYQYEVSSHETESHSQDECLKIVGIVCQLCDKREVHLECDFIKHPTSDIPKVSKIEKVKKRTLECNDCPFTSKLKHFLDEHVKSVHNSELRFQCSACDFKSYFKFEVASHQTENHSQDVDLKIVGIGCQLCEKVEVHVQCDFIQKSASDDLKTSQMKNTNKCEECEYSSRHTVNLDFHVRSLHKKEVRYRCEACQFTNFFKLGVFNHRKSVHNEATPRVIGIGCNSCNDGVMHSECDFVKGIKETNNKLVNKGAQIGVNNFDKGDKVRNKREYSCLECMFVSSKKKYVSSHHGLNHGSESIPKEYILKCDQCELETNKNQTLIIHRRAIHDGEVRFSCQECIYKTFFTQSIKLHITKCHPQTKLRWLIVGCKQCESGIDHKLCEVLSGKTIEKTKKKIRQKVKGVYKYKCEECDFSSPNSNTVDRHKAVLHDKLVRYSCSECNLKAYESFSVKMHMKEAHRDIVVKVLTIACSLCMTNTEHTSCIGTTPRQERPSYNGPKRIRIFKCKVCEYTATRESYIRKHTSIRHTDEALPNDSIVRCTKCEYECEKLEGIDMHTRLVHEKKESPKIKREHYCKECNFKSSKVMYFRSHQALNHGSEAIPKESILKCDQCELETNRTKSLEIHKRAMHNGEVKFACRECPYKTFFRLSIKQHIESQHGGSQLKCIRVGCRQCELGADHEKCEIKKRNMKRKLIKTRQKATGEYKYRCVECSYSAPASKTVRRHTATIHYKETNYSCSGCDFQSYTSFPVKTHISKAHEGLDYKVLTLDCSLCMAKTEHSSCIETPPPQERGKPSIVVKVEQDTLNKCTHCEYTSFKERYVTKHKIFRHGNEALSDESVFRCSICEYECDKLRNLQGHTKTIHDNIVHKCKDCDYTSSNERYIIRHQNFRHGNEALQHKSILRCEKCEYECDKPRNMYVHNRAVHDQTKRFTCGNCDYKSFYSRTVEDHIKSAHKGLDTRPLTVGCTQCEAKQAHARCDTRTTIKSNERYAASMDNKIQFAQYHDKKCELCEYVGSTGQSIRRHSEAVHGDIKRFSCSECNLKSYDKMPLKKHIKRIHQDTGAKITSLDCSACASGSDHDKCLSKRVRLRSDKIKRNSLRTCKFCKFEAVKTVLLLKHIAADHPTKKLYNCDICSYGSNYLPNLKTHKAAKHSGTKFECDICDYKTAWKPPFFEHRREKHGIFLKKSKYKEDLELSESLCDLCGFAGTSKRTMRLHKKSMCQLTSNVTVNSYQSRSKDVSNTSTCEKCVKFASNPKALAQHVAIFHEKKYRNCTLCGFQATSFYQLNTHKYEKHRQGQTNCTVCGIKCQTRFTLLIHMKGKHPESALQNVKGKKNFVDLSVKFSCDLCQYQGQTKINLSLHERRVHAERYLENREGISDSYSEYVPSAAKETNTKTNARVLEQYQHVKVSPSIPTRHKETISKTKTIVLENYPQINVVKV